MGHQSGYLADLKKRLRAAAATGDMSAVLDPAALVAASGLRAYLMSESADLEASSVLGNFHWQRSQALRSEGAAERQEAVSFLTPCFIADVGTVPSELLPELADAALPEATRRLHAALGSTDADLINAALDIWRRIVEATPEEHGDYKARLSDLSVVLSERYRCLGSIPDLDEAITIDRSLVALEPETPRYLINLSIDLCNRYEKTDVPQDIDEALTLADRALSLTPANHPQRDSRLYHRERARELGPWPPRQRSHLAERERFLREVNARNARYLGFLEEMRAELAAFSPGDAAAVLDPKAVRDALALCAMAPNLATDVAVLYASGWLFWCRAISLREDGESADRNLSLAVKLLCLLWYIQPGMVPPQIRVVMERDGGASEDERTEGIEAAYTLWSWYEETGDDNAFIAAIRLLRHEVRRLSGQSASGRAAMDVLAALLKKWHESHPGEPAFEEASLGGPLAEVLRALATLDETAEDFAKQRIDLCESGLALLDGSEAEAIRIYLVDTLATTIAAILEGDLPARSISGMEQRVIRERAIGLLISMLAGLPADHPDVQRAKLHILLMQLYRGRLIGSIGSNERYAIAHGRKAVDLADPAVSQVIWATALEKLATLYTTGFTGNRPERIDEGIGLLEEVISRLDNEVGSELWCRAMFNLGEAYSLRPHGDRDVDLVKAAQIFSQLADAEPLETNPAGWAQTQSGLAAVRFKQSDADGTLHLLHLAEEGYQRAGVDPPPVHYQLLAGAYWYKDDTEQQISVLRRLLDLDDRAVYPARWARNAARLATTILESAPEEAFELLQEAAVALSGEPATARDRAFVSWSLARILLGRNSPQDLSRAIDSLETAKDALQGDLPELLVLICDALGGAYAKAGNWTAAADAFGAAVEALDRHYQMLLVFRSRTKEVSSTARVRHRAAYALARCGRAADSLLMLESVRARLVGDALARDTADLSRLAEASPGAHAAFVSAAEKVRATETAGRDFFQNASVLGAGEQGLHEAARAAYEALAAAVEEIRRLPGMEGFLAAPRTAEIGAAPGHPVAYIVTTQWGSLVLGARRASHDHELAVSIAFADTLADADLLAALALDPLAPPAVIPGPALISAIEQIGDQLAAALAGVIRAPASRVTLVPCGLLGVLPLHLAWTEPAGARHLIDELPVILALSGRLAAAGDGVGRAVTPVVIVSNPHQDLQYASDEVAGITVWFQDAAMLAGARASVAGVRGAVASAGTVHFACHGSQDAASPLTTGLDLANGRLTVAQLLAEHPPLFGAARLLVMSACESAVVDPAAPDEALGLPSAMSYAGASAVVGSLWRVDDVATAIFMASFYARLRAHGRAIPAWGVADALRETQLWMRGATVTELLSAFAVPSAQLRARLRLHDVSDTPFADPRYWAAFTILGA